MKYKNCPELDTVEETKKAMAVWAESMTKVSVTSGVSDTIELLQEGNEKIVEELRSNYDKLTDLYKLKETELAEIKEEAKAAKKYNKVMMGIAIFSAIIAAASVVVSILIGKGII